MKIAIASGKGGTGKTTIAASLARSLIPFGDVWYVDCDVEAPNGHIFLNPDLAQQTRAVVLIPQIQKDKCTACGKCVEVCQFHALAKVGKTILVFPQLCHGCGSCTWNCPEGAIVEVPNPIGVLERGNTKEGIHFARGVLTISEPMPTPIIRQLKKIINPDEKAVVIYDSPPGASCSVVETLRGADFALLVTEPTPFGLHDLKQILGIVDDMHIPSGVVVNRVGIGNEEVDAYLADRNIPVLLRVPFSRELATGIAAGKNLIEILPEYQQKLQNVFQTITSLVNGERS